MTWRDRASRVTDGASWRDRATALDSTPEDPRASTMRRNEARQNVVRAQSEIDDDENRSVLDRAAHGALGVANALDTFGMADELRGAWGAARGALPGGVGAGEGYRRARDAQREATAMAEEQSPGIYGAANTAGLVGSTVAGLAAAPGRAAVNALGQSIKTGSIPLTIAKGAGAGAGIGAGAGFGHSQGDAATQAGDTLMGAGMGLALGGAGAALPAAALRLAPEAGSIPLTLRNVLPTSARAAREGAGNVARGAANAARGTGSIALSGAAHLAEKAPMAAGAAVGGSFGGPLGAAVGGGLGEALGGGLGKAASAKLEGLALRLSPTKQPAPPTAPAPSPFVSAAEELGAFDPIPSSGLQLKTRPTEAMTRESPTAQLEALKERMRASGELDDATSLTKEAERFDPGGEAWKSWAEGVTPTSAIESVAKGKAQVSSTRADRPRTPPDAIAAMEALGDPRTQGTSTSLFTAPDVPLPFPKPVEPPTLRLSQASEPPAVNVPRASDIPPQGMAPTRPAPTGTTIEREAQSMMADGPIPLRQARGAAASRISREKAAKIANEVMALPPSQRGPALQRIAREQGPDVANAAAKAAGLSTKLLGLGA